MLGLWIVLGVLILVALYGVYAYNRLVRLRNRSQFAHGDEKHPWPSRRSHRRLSGQTA